MFVYIIYVQKTWKLKYNPKEEDRKVRTGKQHLEKTKKSFFKSYKSCEVNCICTYAFSKSTVTLKKKFTVLKAGHTKMTT